MFLRYNKTLICKDTLSQCICVVIFTLEKHSPCFLLDERSHAYVSYLIIIFSIEEYYNKNWFYYYQ